MNKELKEEILRNCIRKREGKIDQTWQQLANQYKDYFENGESIRCWTKNELKKRNELPSRDNKISKDTENKLKELDLKRIEFEEKKKQYQTVKLEYNKILRQRSRSLLYIEQIKSSINNLQPLNIPKHIIKNEYEDKVLLINIADPHVGKKGEIKGLQGELLNKYNFEIFQKRMWKIFDKVLKIINKENINHIYLLCEGDCVDGILRNSQLQSLEMGVTDSVIAYCEFISNYINEFSNQHIFVDYYSAYGNHDSLRLLDAKSDKDFPHENVDKLIDYFLKNRLKDNSNVIIHDNQLPYSYFKIFNYNILIHHGEDKDLIKTVKDYMNMYNQHIDFMICGHLHSGYEQTVGLNTSVIRVPSICGIDDFSVRIHKFAKPATKLILLNKNEDDVITYNINLN